MTAVRPQGRTVPKSLRCAVYTRKSTEQGLEQEFNSLDNQREAAEAYVKSQAHEGWRLLPAHYDDGGISGGTLDRPALQRLLDEVRAGRVDIIVVYKVDRLTRSLADFAKLVELFDQHGTSFVSVTQAFNTTTSMGRLTLNVLVSFAQFEREVTGERIRDKIAASKRRGLWLGGSCPLGYQVENKRLVPCSAEAEQVRFMFRRYLEVGSIKALVRDLDSRAMRTRAQLRPDGTQRGGIGFNPTGLCHLLKNRCYVGEVVHKGQYYPGALEPIVDRALFEAVGAALAAKAPQQHHQRANRESLLKGLLYDAKGERMTPASCGPRGPIYRYYISRPATVGRRADAPKRYRVSAPAIEAKVLAVLGWEPASPANASGDTMPSTAALLRQRILVAVERVTVLPETLRIELKGSEDDDPPAPIEVPWISKGRYTKPVIVDPETGGRLSAPMGQQQRARLLQGIANGRRWLEELTAGEVSDIERLAKRENCSPRYVRIVLNLAFLPPDTVRAAIAGITPLCTDDYGLINAAVHSTIPLLHPVGLATIDALLIAAAEGKDGSSNGMRDWSRIGRRDRLIRGRQAIADARGDVDAFIALDLERPDGRHDTMAIADRLLRAGRASEALEWVRRPVPRGLRAMTQADLADASTGIDLQNRERVLLDARILMALGRKDEAQDLRWRTFQALLEVETLRDYVANLGDFEEFDALERAFAFVMAHADAHRALAFFLTWPRLDHAAKLVMEHCDAWAGQHYGLLLPAAQALEHGYPVAATVLYRALLDDILNRARSPAYGHAARYLAKLEELGACDLSGAGLTEHKAYRAGLRRSHGRKSGFWSLADGIGANHIRMSRTAH